MILNNRQTIIFLLLASLPSFLASQELEDFEREHYIQGGDSLDYRILYPQGFSEEEQYPLVLFLHGAGERGNDNEAQLIHGGEMFLENKSKQDHPAIVIFPQCSPDDYWANVKDRKNGFTFSKKAEPTPALSLVLGLLDEMLEKPFVKKDQVYAGGLSMGAMGTLELLYRRPGTFAGAIAICGGAHPQTARHYAEHTEVWLFHGARDQVVSPGHSIAMARAITEAGGKANLTVYESATHNSWDPAFAEPGLLDWLFSRKLD